MLALYHYIDIYKGKGRHNKDSKKQHGTHRLVNAEVLCKECCNLLGSWGVEDDPCASTGATAHHQPQGPRTTTLCLFHTAKEEEDRHMLGWEEYKQCEEREVMGIMSEARAGTVREKRKDSTYVRVGGRTRAV